MIENISATYLWQSRKKYYTYFKSPNFHVMKRNTPRCLPSHAITQTKENSQKILIHSNTEAAS